MFVDRAKCRSVSKDAIKQFEIKAPSEDFVVANLSGGNQQKVSVAKGIALHPKIIILDEPTHGVDVNAKAEIYSIISGFAKEELGVLMISSEMPELLGMVILGDALVFDAANVDQFNY